MSLISQVLRSDTMMERVLCIFTQLFTKTWVGIISLKTDHLYDIRIMLQPSSVIFHSKNQWVLCRKKKIFVAK